MSEIRIGGVVLTETEYQSWRERRDQRRAEYRLWRERHPMIPVSDLNFLSRCVSGYVSGFALTESAFFFDANGAPIHQGVPAGIVPIHPQVAVRVLELNDMLSVYRPEPTAIFGDIELRVIDDRPTAHLDLVDAEWGEVDSLANVPIKLGDS